MAKVKQSVFLFFVVATMQTTLSANIPPGIIQTFQHPQPPIPVAKPKQTIQQFQVAVVIPPGAQPVQGNQPPGPPNPEYVWLQIPASYFTSQSPLTPTQRPDAIFPPPTHRPDIFVPPPNQQPDSIKPLKPGDSPVVPANPPFVPAVQQPVPTTESPSADLLLKRCVRPRGQFPSDACNKYINCWDGVAVEQFCPKTLVFNVKGYCDYAYNVECGGRPVVAIPPPPASTETSTAAPGQTSSQAPTTAAPPTVIVSLPTIDPNLRKKCVKPRGQFRSEVCNKYVNCWDDVVIEQECPEGLLFSNKGYCDYPHNVDCKNLTVPSRNVIDADSECPLDAGTFREKTNCANYFTCIGWKVVARYTCPTNLKFNDNLGVCDYEERVDCSKEPLVFIPKSNNFLTDVPKDFMKKIDECKPGSVFALNPQCTAACLCHDGVSEVVQCPSGLAYDSQTDKCLLPHLAKC